MSLNQITSPKTVRLALALKREYTRSFFSGEYEKEHSLHVTTYTPSYTTAEINAMEWEAAQREFSLMNEGAVAAVAMDKRYGVHVVCYPLPVPVMTKRAARRPTTHWVGMW